jgi:hypothetical protein
MSINPTMFKSHDMHSNTDSPMVAVHSTSHGAHGTRAGSIEYRVTYALVFMVCLAITGLCRLLPRNRHPWICAGDDGSASLWSEARSAADSTVPYIFQQ